MIRSPDGGVWLEDDMLTYKSQVGNTIRKGYRLLDRAGKINAGTFCRHSYRVN